MPLLIEWSPPWGRGSFTGGVQCLASLLACWERKALRPWRIALSRAVALATCRVRCSSLIEARQAGVWQPFKGSALDGRLERD
jgi:hypothetical protein